MRLTDTNLQRRLHLKKFSYYSYIIYLFIYSCTYLLVYFLCAIGLVNKIWILSTQ